MNTTRPTDTAPARPPNGRRPTSRRQTNALVRRLRPLAPHIAGAAAEAARAQPLTYEPGPAPDRHDLLPQAISAAIGGFLDAPHPPGPPAPEIWDAFERVGAAEARSGRTADEVRAALSTAAAVAAEQLTEHGHRHGLALTPRQAGALARAGVIYLEHLYRAALTGHAAASADAAADHDQRRLVEMILRPGVDPVDLGQAAAQAGWPLPRMIAAVAVSSRRVRTAAPRFLPAEALNGLHLSQPCLLFPDPSGPGRRAVLHTMLGDHPAVVGPTVGITQAALSLRLARRGLQVLPADWVSAHTPLHVTEHVPTILLARDPALAQMIADRKLAPLSTLRPSQRARLATTLLAYFECGANTTTIAARLHIHPQTVRYRVRMLNRLFGPDLQDPNQILDYLMALHAWRLHPPPPP